MNLAARESSNGPWEPASRPSGPFITDARGMIRSAARCSPPTIPAEVKSSVMLRRPPWPTWIKALAAARLGFLAWRDVAPLERGRILKQIAKVLRDNAREWATIDAASCGDPVRSGTRERTLYRADRVRRRDPRPCALRETRFSGRFCRCAAGPMRRA